VPPVPRFWGPGTAQCGCPVLALLGRGIVSTFSRAPTWKGSKQAKNLGAPGPSLLGTGDSTTPGCPIQNAPFAFRVGKTQPNSKTVAPSKTRSLRLGSESSTYPRKGVPRPSSARAGYSEPAEDRTRTGFESGHGFSHAASAPQNQVSALAANGRARKTAQARMVFRGPRPNKTQNWNEQLGTPPLALQLPSVTSVPEGSSPFTLSR
jgi:hypothetical protein